jgi:hypothetical protein
VPVTCRSCKGSISYIARSIVEDHFLAGTQKQEVILKWKKPNTKDRWSNTRCLVVEDSTEHEPGQEGSDETDWDVALAVDCGKRDGEEQEAEMPSSSQAIGGGSDSAGQYSSKRKFHS